MKTNTRLTEVAVDGLFGQYDYRIPLTSESGELDILTGPNGYGKSTLLRLIAAVLRHRFIDIAPIDFDSFTLKTNEEKALTLKRERDESSARNDIKISCILTAEETFSWTIRCRDLPPFGALDDSDYPGRTVPFRMRRDYERVGAELLRNKATGELITFDELNLLSTNDRWIEDAEGLPSWLEDFSKNIETTHISADRLIDFSAAHGRNRSSLSILNIAKELKGELEKHARRADSHARKLEQSFPRRLETKLKDLWGLFPIGTRDSTIYELRDKSIFRFDDVINMIETNESLMDMGLVERTEEDSDGFLIKVAQAMEGVTRERINEIKGNELALIKNFTQSEILWTIAEDLIEKSEEIAKETSRLQLFVRSVNKLLLNKKLRLDRDRGVVVSSSTGEKGDDDEEKSGPEQSQEIPLTSLSSGEQHLVVLYAKLILQTTAKSLILIDEPEISLHPDWQEAFPIALEEIAKVSGMQVILATHSPTIIQDRWDRATDLTEALSNIK